MRTFWLSFCDGDRPTGEQFLGVAVVDVSDDQATAALEDIKTRFTHAQPGAEWLGAAMREAWRLGCNPGGEVQSMELPQDDPRLVMVPRGRLMQKPELEDLERRLTEAVTDA